MNSTLPSGNVFGYSPTPKIDVGVCSANEVGARGGCWQRGSSLELSQELFFHPSALSLLQSNTQEVWVYIEKREIFSKFLEFLGRKQHPAPRRVQHFPAPSLGETPSRWHLRDSSEDKQQKEGEKAHTDTRRVDGQTAETTTLYSSDASSTGTTA